MSPTVAEFIAREPELELLAAALERAREGSASAVIIGGDAGVGKTRLVERMCELAQAEGAVVAIGHCLDIGEVGLPYLPIVEALGQVRGLSAVGDVVARRPPLGRLLDGDSPGPPGNDELGRLQLFEAIATAFASVGSSSSPLVVVMEDLHWADASSRDVLRFLLSRMRSEHLLIVGTYRSDDLHRRHPWRAALAELHRQRRTEHLPLAPFSDAELRRFTRAITGGELAESTQVRIQHRSEGNPYYAEELLAAGGGFRLPETLADVLRVRLERLEPNALRLARMASVAGRRLPERLLRAVVDRRGRPEEAESLGDALRECLEQQVLRREGEQLAFRHALLAEAVYEDLLPGEATALHRTFAEVMSADPSLGSASQVAHHAQQGHDSRTTILASHQAAAEARGVFAPAEELRHLETVLGLWDLVPDAASILGRSAVETGLAAAAAAGRAGRTERALALARAALDAAGSGVQRAPFAYHLAHHLIASASPTSLTEAFAVARGALEVLEKEDSSPELAWTLATCARAALNTGRDEVAGSMAERAIVVARRLDVPDAEADALTTLAVLEVAESDRAAELLRQAHTRAVAAGDLFTAARARYNLATNRYHAGALDEAAELARAGLAEAWASGFGWSQYVRRLDLLGEIIRFAMGDLTPRSGEEPPEDYAAQLQAVGMFAATARGDADTVDRCRELISSSGFDDGVYYASGNLVDSLSWEGRAAEAVAEAEASIARTAEKWGQHFLGSIWLAALGVAALADLATEAGGADAAARERGAALVRQAHEAATLGRPRGGALGPEGRAWLLRVDAEHGRLRGEDSAAAWEACLEGFAYGNLPELARCSWRLAQVLVASGDREAAEEAAQRALSQAERMGAGQLAAAVRQLVRRARLTVPGVRAETASVLTQREQDVLALVAQGLSNRQIGERLYISGKTVSVHISNVIAKLGVSGRTEAVVVAQRRGLLEVA